MSDAQPAEHRITLDPAWSMVKQTWRWYNDHLKPLLQLSLLAVIPSFLLQIVLSLTQHPASGITNSNIELVISFGLGFFLWSVFNLFWTMLGTVAIYLYLRTPDTKKSTWQLFMDARRHVVNYFSTTIVYGLIIFGGLILLFVPGLIWAITFGFAPLIAIYESVSVGDALKRSKVLTKNHWFDIFWRGVLLVVTIIGVSIVANLVITIINRLGFPTRGLSVIPDLLGVLLNACLTPVPLIMVYLIYTKLKHKA